MKNFKQSAALVASLIFVLTATSQAQVLVVKKSGRKPASELKYRQAGVPVFELVQKQGDKIVKVKEIPALDIGEEKTIQAGEFAVQIPPKRELKLQQVGVKTSPEMVRIPSTVPLIPVPKVKNIVPADAFTKVPVVKILPLIPDPTIAETQPQTQNLVEIKGEEFKMLQALIFLDYKKKYDLAMSLFVELMDVPQFRSQAMFHYAQTALGLKLNSEFRQKMVQVTIEAKDPVLKKMAVESLTKNISSLEISDIALIDPLIEVFDIDITSNPKYLLKKAKYYSEKGNLGEFENALLYIPSNVPEYQEATLLKAVFNYRQGQIDLAVQDLELLWPLVEPNKKDAVRNLAALTLARLYFQKGDYKNAYKNYLLVDKSSGQWLQSMVEQAWTQILAGDYEGAAGNMFSLHTDFFKKAYSPNTYIVRTVGYLNLCQYGDGLSVLDDLNKKYKSIHAKLESFQNNNKDSIKYYDLVKLWMRNTNLEEVDGVPRSFIVELARHPSYMSVQKQINNYEDENSRFNKITIDLIRKEREARLEMLKAKNTYLAAKREKSSALAEFEKTYLALGVEHVIYSRAREGIKKMREAAVVRLQTEENTLRNKAAVALQGRYTEFAGTLDHLIDQKEVLSYEIYSGAGEHIRYQMAGGAINDRQAASLTPEEKESYKWKFKGEVWEDEIGHYRSSLKSVCAKEDVASNP